ncbi:allophanate hydrolase subunit 1 [bacterium]|nr:allophanate hydrolase subunit 1 [bacterium]
MLVKPYGDRGILLSELSDTERSIAVGAFQKALPDGCYEFVLGYDSLLLVGEVSQLRELDLDQIFAAAGQEPSQRSVVEIDVHYDGEDLESVAEAIGASTDEVIRLHTSPVYTVRMMGFSPGFPYLDGLDERLHLERRESPRNRIEPGTVAIGGLHAGIYTVASPGGWHLLGRTEHPLFNLDAAASPGASVTDVFALSLGDRIRFKAV